MKVNTLSLVLIVCTCFLSCAARSQNREIGSALDFTVVDIDGDSVDLASYKGKVLLIVNVASECGLTDQYEELQELYETYSDRGFSILAFPSNDFLGQEPGSNEEIKQFCSENYNVSFPIFAKISVSGDSQSPLYKYLTENAPSEFSGGIRWNFDKFVVNRSGKIVERFHPLRGPANSLIVEAIEKTLDEKSPQTDKP